MPTWLEYQRMKSKKGTQVILEQKRKRIEIYYENPIVCKRVECSNILTYKLHNSRVFCSHQCAAITSNINRVRTSKKKKCFNCNEPTSRKFCSNDCNLEYKRIEIEEKFNLGLVSSRSTIRKIMIKRNGHICVLCKLSEWVGKTIPLDLDHIDGNSENNTPINLRLICRNCHGQTPTYGSKNNGNGRGSIKKRKSEIYVSD